MSEIKYRQWLGDKWHYWGFLKTEHGLRFVGPMQGDITLEEARKNSQQFANLNDKHGTEIYEGDIICDEHGTRVVYDITKIPAMTTSVEIIGNIYENPNLLHPSQ